jgi:hypothetical protein
LRRRYSDDGFFFLILRGCDFFAALQLCSFAAVGVELDG